MKYDITTSHMHTQHWIVEADSKDEAEKILKNAQLVWQKEKRIYIMNNPSEKIKSGLITSPDAIVRAINLVPGQTEPNVTTLARPNTIDELDGEE
jgi:hypothetical protein|tara:strand:- start:222 stop:506 length:285 start_codon:yes stop_codon:yes gene_type:complete